MKINKEFEITTDKDKNYILIQTYKTKVGTYTTKERYYPTLEAALSGCLKQRILKNVVEMLFIKTRKILLYNNVCISRRMYDVDTFYRMVSSSNMFYTSISNVSMSSSLLCAMCTLWRSCKYN